MNSIDIKSLLIGALFTAVVFLSTGWQQSITFPRTMKVEITKAPPLKFERPGQINGGGSLAPFHIKQQK
tara:strand:+ start:246 stop:452 length:207 start_codon:yes stop_codon:yes gene_type:complete